MLNSAEQLKYKLSELANSEPSHIEIYWQDQNENEFSTEESVPGIAEEALARIRSLESAINQTIIWVELTGSLRPDDGGETFRLLKDLVSDQPSLLDQDQGETNL